MLCEKVAMKSKYGASDLYIYYSKDIAELVH